MNKNAVSALLFVVVLLTGVFITTSQASAWTTNPLPSIDGAGLPRWNWPDTIKTEWNCSGTCNALPWFSAETSSYIIGSNPSATGIPAAPDIFGTVYTNFFMAVAPDGDRLVFNKKTDGTYELKTVSGAGFITANLQDHTKTTAGGHDNYGNAPMSAPVSAPITNLTGIYRVKNVNYSTTWDGGSFSSDIAYGSVGGSAPATCGALDFGCWFSKAFDGVQNTMVSVAEAVAKAFAYMFAPDGNKTKTEFDGLNTFMTNKLGFLVYPFTFMSTLFNAFSSGTSWCTTTSCTKSFGNLFGKPFNLNLNQLAVTMPTLWTWFIAMTRGITVLAIVLTIRRKYIGIMHK